MIEGLRRNNIEVIECHEQLWYGIDDREKITLGGWMDPRFGWRVIKTYWKLLKNYLQMSEYDVMVVGYPGQFDVFMARFLTWLRRKHLVWDVFMSIYLISIERKLQQKSSLTVELFKIVEWIGLRLPDSLILDTSNHKDWMKNRYNLPTHAIHLVPTGADDRIFFPKNTKINSHEIFVVVYFGTFIQNHGIDYIIETANILKENKDIVFWLIGDGPERENAKELSKSLDLNNVIFFDWLDKHLLREKISLSNVCLGSFGHTTMSQMTVHNKIFEGMAMAKPVISGDSNAVRSYFCHMHHIYLVDREKPGSMVTAILKLKKNPDLAKKMGINGYEIFQEKYSLDRIGKQFAYLLQKVNQ